jgi:hypothetical protein
MLSADDAVDGRTNQERGSQARGRSRCRASTSTAGAARRGPGRPSATVAEAASTKGQNTGVPLSRISWIVTVGICLIAALLLLLEGYSGYSGLLLEVGAAAAVNLL